MNQRRLHKAIGPREVRILRNAVYEASRHGHPLNVTLTLHPGMFKEPPSDPGQYFHAELKKIGNWFRRKVGPWWALWVRENYDGANREHLHLLVHVPPQLRSDFVRAVARWWPQPKVAVADDVDDPQKALAYMLKQMTPQAHFALRRLVRRETHSRHDRAKVGAVLGKRTGLTRPLLRLVSLRAKPTSFAGNPQRRGVSQPVRED